MIQAVWQVLLERKQYTTDRKVTTWLSKQFTYILYKPACYDFKTNRVFAEGIDYQWQADLAD